jgi:probable HAF family extracellular repeat protein
LSGYTITNIGPIAYSDPQGMGPGYNGINNAPVVQVVGQNANNHAYLWDSVHGMQDLGTLGKDADSGAAGINDSGQVVGTSYTETFNNQFGYPVITSQNAFLWSSAGGMKSIGSGDRASGINSSGEVVGTLGESRNNTQAALWSGGHWTGLGSLDGGKSYGYGINDYGQVVANENGTSYDFLWTPNTPGGTTGTKIGFGPGLFAINGQGFVTGASGGHAFVWAPSSANGTSGTMTDLGALDGFWSYGNSINNSGTVVGTSTGGSASFSAVIWQKGSNGYTMTDLNNLIPAGTGWTLIEANAINNQGQIVVEATQNGSAYYALLLTPSTTTTALAQPASSTPATSTAGPTAAPGSDPSLAPLLARPLSDSTSFGPTTVAVALSVAQPLAAASGVTSPALPLAQAPLFAPSLTSTLPPAGPATDSPPPARASTSAADQVFASLDAELSSAPFGEDLALAGGVPMA